ncbi:hypothetical protein AB0I22_20925 [Streptomyces sp. NPDC050610]|uniref:hypothetical protein n=1 Tax=Streptomyces sp. NPDC050610 TaxID=3157097 RepID=UPI00342DF7B8
MRTRGRVTVMAALFSALSLTAFAQSAVAASPAPQPADKTSPWQVSQGSASASGTHTNKPLVFFQRITVEGEFKNTGSGCSTLWFQWGDESGASFEKSASSCGPGTVPVKAQADVPVSGNSFVYICKGTEDVKDCGSRVLIS